MVTKLRASDATILGRRRVGSVVGGLAFDGVHIWLTNGGDDTVMRLRSVNGVLQHTYAVDDFPAGIVFAGDSVWATNNFSSTVVKISRNQ